MIESDIHYVRYSFFHGPGSTERLGDILLANCQAWGHEVYRQHGFILPPWYLSKEAFEDETVLMRTVEPSYKPLDLFLFGPEQLQDARKLHWAIGVSGGTEPLLTHLNVIDGVVGVWPITQFARVPRYGKLFAVKRPVGLRL